MKSTFEPLSNAPLHPQYGLKHIDRRKKRKLDKNTTYEELVADWTQCCFLIANKSRLCNVARVPNSLYCGNHLVKDSYSEQIDVDIRIPCPLDPTHTIFARNKEVHIKICNAGHYNKTLESLPYYSANCNSGVTSKTTEDEEVNFVDLLNKIENAYQRIQFDLPIVSVTDFNSLDGIIRMEVGGTQSAFDRVRHVEQDISLVHHMINHNVLSTLSPPPLVLEYGAGKGLLTRCIHLAAPQAAFVLIERSANRRKVDRYLADKQVSITRLRMDIRHIYLPNIPSLVDNSIGTYITSLHENQLPHNKVATDANITHNNTLKPPPNILAVAKHLCGVASDLAIRSLSHLSRHTDRVASRALAVATCCHHACVYDDYVGLPFITQCGFTQKDFVYLKKWSGWAHLDRTAAHRRGSGQQMEVAGDDIDEHKIPAHVARRPDCIAKESMPQLGKKVKRVLDYGRVCYLREVLGMEVKYFAYCDEKLSPECMLILASDRL